MINNDSKELREKKDGDDYEERFISHTTDWFISHTVDSVQNRASSLLIP